MKAVTLIIFHQLIVVGEHCFHLRFEEFSLLLELALDQFLLMADPARVKSCAIVAYAVQRLTERVP